MATLVDLDYNLLEIPRYLLPVGVGPGSVVKLAIVHDVVTEEKRKSALDKLEGDIKKRQKGKGNSVL